MFWNSLVLTMLAGFMNGTYAFPIKYMKSWKEENIWLVFSPIAFLLMPWFCLSIMNYQTIRFIGHMPENILFILILGGFLFGIGMIVFTLSLRFVGIGISFMLNISSSTVIATLLPILTINPAKLASWFGLAEIFALVLFCIAMVTSYLASSYKVANKAEKEKSHVQANAVKGVSLGILSGILTSAQGFSYAYATTLLQTKFANYPGEIIMSSPWIPIFSAAFVPYFGYFLFRCLRDKSLKNIVTRPSINYVPLCIIMGILYFGSLLVFDHASLLLGNMGVVIAWPLLMIFIILTSNLWSFIHQEWRKAHRLAFNYLSVSLFCLILAVASLSFASYLNMT